MAKLVNQKVGIPGRVDVNKPQELQRAIDTILQFLRTANGENDGNKRYVTAAELASTVASLTTGGQGG
jgi:hypothetical protein